MSDDALKKMMTEVVTEVTGPYLTAVREALDTVARLEVQSAFGERIATLEEKVNRLEVLEDRIRTLEAGHAQSGHLDDSEAPA